MGEVVPHTCIKVAAKRAHPDQGGSHDAMNRGLCRALPGLKS